MDNRNIVDIIRIIANEEIDKRLGEVKQQNISVDLEESEKLTKVINIAMKELKREIRTI